MPDITLKKTSVFSHDAWRLENDQIRVDVIPSAGAKIVSMFDKQAGVEWLVQPEHSNPFQISEYGAEYNTNQCGGWDEMFPTILACSYPAPGAWQGIELPDHGEVWMMPWDDTGTGAETIRLSVEGRALPYRLSRSLAFSDGRTVRFDYVLQNLGDEPFVYLWTPHPQFLIEPGSTMILPPDVTEVINVLPEEWGIEWGGVGTRNSWPAIQYAHGDRLRQDVIAPPSANRGRKFYLPPEQAISYMGLRQPSGASLRMGWDAVAQPYCGVWIDEGILNKVSDVGIEPASGYYDSLALAWSNQKISVLAPQSECSWRLHVTLGSQA
ncbi:MAG: hypothetical protein GY759_16965 [Chloroflexi bacterium]|nr:hypothetical protein [Chloroflexota bacterium]